MFCKKWRSEKLHKIHGKTPVLESLFNKTPTQVFSYEFCDIFKNTFFTEHLPATAFGETEISGTINQEI